MCEASASIHASHELEHKMDKKSVIVTLINGAEKQYMEIEDEVSYDFQIGEHNGCLLIVEKREVDSVISVPDEEKTYYAYAAHAWSVAKLV